MKTCPFCAQMIQDEAIKCRHCGGWIDKGAEAKQAEAAADSSKLLAVKIYSYLLLVLAALYGLGMFVAFIARGSGVSGSFGFPELIIILVFVAMIGALIFVALGLMKRKRIAYILNIILLAVGLISGIFLLVYSAFPEARPEGAAEVPSALSASVPLILMTGAWLAYFIGKRRLFLNRDAAEKGDQ